MPQRGKPGVYRWLAQSYDAIFPPDQSPMQRARTEILREILPEVKCACDLACGTGVTAVALAGSGIKTFAVDLSPDMCRLTREKAVREQLPVEVIEADMRSFRLPHPVDLVTCESDAINHVPCKDDLHRVTKNVAQALKPGGYFLFDVNNARGFRKYWLGNVWLERPGVVVVMRNGHSGDAQRAWSDVELFIREGEGWRRHHERVEEVCWTREEIGRSLRGVGFDKLEARDAAPFFRDNPLVTRGCHTLYLARKSR
jgi:SAM-dependent methyltransferase